MSRFIVLAAAAYMTLTAGIDAALRHPLGRWMAGRFYTASGRWRR